MGKARCEGGGRVKKDMSVGGKGGGMEDKIVKDASFLQCLHHRQDPWW